MQDHARQGFVTGQLLRIGLTDGQAEFISAGHPWPLRMRSRQVREITPGIEGPWAAEIDTKQRSADPTSSYLGGEAPPQLLYALGETSAFSLTHRLLTCQQKINPSGGIYAAQRGLSVWSPGGLNPWSATHESSRGRHGTLVVRLMP